MIRSVTPKDAAELAAIYNHYIENTIITFEEESISVDAYLARIHDTASKYPWLVYEHENRIVGFTYASAWKARSAYRHCAEATLYLSPMNVGKGIGTILYSALIDQLRCRQMHSLIAGIAVPNDASIALHKKLGFEKIGYFKEVGKKFDDWLDVEYWELIL